MHLHLSSLVTHPRAENLPLNEVSVLHAARRLAKSGDSADLLAVPQLVEWLDQYKRSNPTVAVAVVGAIGTVRGIPTLSIPALMGVVEMHNTGCKHVASAAAQALGRFGDDARGYAPRLHDVLRKEAGAANPSKQVVLAVCSALFSIDSTQRRDPFVMQVYQSAMGHQNAALDQLSAVRPTIVASASATGLGTQLSN